MLAGRVVSALAHGGYFGIGAVLASSLVSVSKKASAVAALFAGLTIANVGSCGVRRDREPSPRIPRSSLDGCHHLRTLERAGLATATTDRKRHLYALDTNGLAAVRSYLDDLPSRPVAQLSIESCEMRSAGTTRDCTSLGVAAVARCASQAD